MATDEQVQTLIQELDARWRIVETSWAAGIGPNLVTEGVAVDLEHGVITDRRRRKSVAGVTATVIATLSRR